MKLYQSNSASSERSRGFTLLELMTVVAILSVLTTVAVPAFVRQMRRGHTVEAVEGLDKIAAGAKVYFHNHEAFPASSASWVPAMDHPTACANHAGQIPAAGAEFDVDRGNRCSLSNPTVFDIDTAGHTWVRAALRLTKKALHTLLAI